MVLALRSIPMLALLCSGCLLDSVEPWLPKETIVETAVPLDGEWTVVDEVALFGSQRKITLERKPATEHRAEFYYLTIRPLKRDAQFVFEATVHEIGGLRFLQIGNFSHWGGDTFGLANRPTYSLWRVEADADNIVVWMPDLGLEPGGSLKTVRDQDDKPLFVDTARNNATVVREWVRATRDAEERPRHVLGLALTRKGTPFTTPATAEPHLPALPKGSRPSAPQPRR